MSTSNTNRCYRILFVRPHVTIATHFARDMPLGVLYLSAYLKNHLGDEVEIEFLDLITATDKKATLARRVAAFEPDMVGISLLSYQRSFFTEYRDVLSDLPGSPLVVIGGPYATCEYEDALLQHRMIDCAVVGEGERVLLNLVEAHRSGKAIKGGIRGLAWRERGTVVANGREEPIEDLDALGLPDYSLVNPQDYWGYHVHMNVVLAHREYMPVISSRGCPYRCAYCHDIFGKKVRKRSAEHFVAELQMLHDDYGIREFHIVDDIFNADRKRMREILRRVIDSGMKISFAFPNGVRGDLLDEDDIRLLQRAGVYMITFAIESASERIQKLISKNLDIGKVMRNIDAANRLGLLTKSYFMIGFPHETIDEIESTIALACNSELDMASFFIVAPQAGTELHAMAASTIEGGFSSGSGEYYHSKSYYQRATGYNLKRKQNLAYLRFYTPRRLARMFAKAPWKSYLLICLLNAGWMLLQSSGFKERLRPWLRLVGIKQDRALP